VVQVVEEEQVVAVVELEEEQMEKIQVDVLIVERLTLEVVAVALEKERMLVMVVLEK
jgi:uncharacterized membrane protein YqjE